VIYTRNYKKLNSNPHAKGSFFFNYLKTWYKRDVVATYAGVFTGRVNTWLIVMVNRGLPSKNDQTGGLLEELHLIFTRDKANRVASVQLIIGS
jgi:hypothetical protein